MKQQITELKDGVNIHFNTEIKKEKIILMVENCKQGQCECMSQETKQKITNMQVNGEDGKVELRLSGDISTSEVKQALSKSKVLNKI